MPNYDFCCTECGIEEVVFLSYEARDEARPCMACTAPMQRVWRKMPGVASASLPDGYKRPEVERYKEARRIERDAEGKGQKAREEAKKEAAKIKGKPTHLFKG